MKAVVDLTGLRFGRLTVVGLAEKNSYGRICWVVDCDCGTRRVAAGQRLKNGSTKSCGCLSRELTSLRFKGVKRDVKKGPPPTPATAADHLEKFDVLMAGTWTVTAQGYLGTRRILGGKVYRITQHRLILAKKLGRPLETAEVAHHIDGCRTNNHPDNLALMTHGSHSREHLLERLEYWKPKHRAAPKVTLTCSSCGTTFQKPESLHRVGSRKGQRPCCSRSCAGRIGGKQ